MSTKNIINPTKNSIVTNERGAALVVALIMLVIMTTMGATLTFTSIVEGWLSANYRDSKQAFYIAEAGIEHTRSHLRVDNDWNDGVTGVTLEEVTLGQGGFTISLTERAKDSITVTSTGRVGIAGATSTVEVLIERTSMIVPSAALGFVGDVGITLSGPNFFIDGGTDKYGITMSDFTADDTQPPQDIIQDIIDDIIDDNIANQVIGRGLIPSVGSADETTKNISDFVSAMKGMADITIKKGDNEYTGGHVTYTGSLDDPKIVHITATEDEDFSGDIVGAGILIIEGKNFDFSFEQGNINFNGLVIITGSSVGGSLNNVSIEGALIINENIEEEWRWVDIYENNDDNVGLIYSQEHLSAAKQAIPALVSSWRQVHN